MPDTYHPDLLLLATALIGRPVKLPGPSRPLAKRLLRSAGEHGVTQLLARRVREGSVHGFTDEERDTLNKSARSQAAYDLLLNEATSKTLDLLKAANVPALLLKGTPVAVLYYPDTYLRTRCDTDILIPTTDTQRAAGVLAAHGYQISGLGGRTYSSKQFSAVHVTERGFGSSFDIHWRLSNRVLFRDLLQFDACWETRQSLPRLGNNAYTLSPADLLLHACIHRIAHGRNTERNRLIWLYDAHLMASSFSSEDFVRFRELAIEKGVGTLCQDALAMCQYYFRTSSPEGYLAALARNRRQEPTAGLVKASKRKWAIADLMALKTRHEKLAFAGELLSPPSMAEYSGFLPRARSWTKHLLARLG